LGYPASAWYGFRLKGQSSTLGIGLTAIYGVGSNYMSAFT